MKAICERILSAAIVNSHRLHSAVCCENSQFVCNFYCHRVNIEEKKSEKLQVQLHLYRSETE